MSKSKIDDALLDECIANILKFANGEKITVSGEEKQGKKRKFVETVEFQIALKNIDPAKDKRFNSTVRLHHPTKKNMKVCVLGNETHCTQATAAGIDSMSVEDMKKLNRNKKLVKQLAGRYDVFLASHNLIKQIPRLLGPGLTRAGKFPTLIGATDSLEDKLDDMRCTVKLQMKKVLCISAPVGNVELSASALKENILLTGNFLASLLKKGWQNVGALYIKSTMGPRFQIYF